MFAANLISAAVRYSGLPLLVRKTLARNKATVLLYHDPKPDVLEQHLAYLSKGYQFVPLSQIVDAIHAKDWSGLPANALAITVDDGHRGNAELGDVCRKYGGRPMIYLCSQIVGTLRHFWVDTPSPNPDHLQAYKRFPNEERLRILQEELGYTPTREYPEHPRQALSHEEIEELKQWADVGSHGRFHPILTTCGDAECEQEIATSRQELESLTGLECSHFCYPNGDYTLREVEFLKQAGYRSGRGCDVGWNDLNTDPYRLKIIPVSDDADVNKLATQMTGLAGLLVARRKSGRWDGVRAPFTVAETSTRRFSDQP